MEGKNTSYKDLVVWQKSIQLVLEIYNLTKTFPKEEIYGLTSQMRRCSVSISSNIAEGQRRGSKNDFKRFLLISFGSGAELETQIEIAKKLNYGQKANYQIIDLLLNEIMRMLNKLISSLDNAK